jgi:hypothetical protein
MTLRNAALDCPHLCPTYRQNQQTANGEDQAVWLSAAAFLKTKSLHTAAQHTRKKKKQINQPVTTLLCLFHLSNQYPAHVTQHTTRFILLCSAIYI